MNYFLSAHFWSGIGAITGIVGIVITVLIYFKMQNYSRLADANAAKSQNETKELQNEIKELQQQQWLAMQYEAVSQTDSSHRAQYALKECRDKYREKSHKKGRGEQITHEQIISLEESYINNQNSPINISSEISSIYDEETRKELIQTSWQAAPTKIVQRSKNEGFSASDLEALSQEINSLIMLSMENEIIFHEYLYRIYQKSVTLYPIYYNRYGGNDTKDAEYDFYSTILCKDIFERYQLNTKIMSIYFNLLDKISLEKDFIQRMLLSLLTFIADNLKISSLHINAYVMSLTRNDNSEYPEVVDRENFNSLKDRWHADTDLEKYIASLLHELEKFFDRDFAYFPDDCEIIQNTTMISIILDIFTSALIIHKGKQFHYFINEVVENMISGLQSLAKRQSEIKNNTPNSHLKIREQIAMLELALRISLPSSSNNWSHDLQEVMACYP